jgi:hypothetical protein
MTYVRRPYTCVCVCVRLRTRLFFLLKLLLELHIYLLVDLMFSRWVTVMKRNITLCSLIGCYRHFDVTCWLRLQDRKLLFY